MKPIRTVIFVLSLALAAFGFTQSQPPLPDTAQEALAQGEAAMDEALATYGAQYPDRELWQEAFRHGRRAQSLAPGHPAPLRFLAEAYSRANWYGPAWQAWLDYLDAENLLDSEATPLFAEVGNWMGFNYYNNGRLADAAEVFTRVIDEVPFDLDAHVWMGRILMEQGRPEAAISYWQTVVERNPQDNRAQYFLDLAREQSRWGVEAVTAFREGVAFFESSEFDRARERFARATVRNPDYPAAWAWLGRIAFEAGNYSDSRTYYERASRLAPDNNTYRYFFEESGRRLDAQAQEGAAQEAASEGLNPEETERADPE